MKWKRVKGLLFVMLLTFGLFLPNRVNAASLSTYSYVGDTHFVNVNVNQYRVDLSRNSAETYGAPFIISLSWAMRNPNLSYGSNREAVYSLSLNYKYYINNSDTYYNDIALPVNIDMLRITSDNKAQFLYLGTVVEEMTYQDLLDNYGLSYNAVSVNLFAVLKSDIDGYNIGYDAGYGFGYSAGHTSGYDVGYDAGYDVGYDAGYDIGYDAGYDVGYDLGDETGYARGILDNNGAKLSIVNFIPSILTAVGGYFLTLGEISLFGISLNSLLGGLLAIFLIVFVIKFFIR